MIFWSEVPAMQVHPGAWAGAAIFTNWFVAWWNGANSMTLIRFLLSFGAAGFTIATLHRTLFNPANSEHDHGKDPVRFAVAMNATIFVVCGLAVTSTAASNWETALLVAGSSLLAGGFIGLLFGVPQKQSTQVVQTPAMLAQHAALAQQDLAAQGRANPEQINPNAPNQAQAQAIAAQISAAQASKSKDNLVVESAATLGKVLTGFTLAQVGPIYRHFLEISRAISHHLSDGSVPPNAVLAGAILIYFFATGFLSGLFLPNYFMKDYR